MDESKLGEMKEGRRGMKSEEEMQGNVDEGWKEMQVNEGRKEGVSEEEKKQSEREKWKGRKKYRKNEQRNLTMGAEKKVTLKESKRGKSLERKEGK